MASVPFDQLDGEIWFNVAVAIWQWGSYFNPAEKLKSIRPTPDCFLNDIGRQTVIELAKTPVLPHQLGC